MSVKKQELKEFYQNIKEQKIIESTLGLLQWDQETKMPEQNTKYRAEQISYFSTIHHAKKVDPNFIKLVNNLYDSKEKLDKIDKRSVEVVKKDIDKSVKLPKDFVSSFSKTKSEAHLAWLNAKKNNRFELFSPYLKKIIELTKKYAAYIDDNSQIYDVLLDDYEEGMKADEVQNLFTQLKKGLVDILSQIKKEEVTDPLSQFIDFSEEKVEQFLIELIQKIGFSMKRGTVGRVHHPFETSLSPKDIRINMSYYHKDLLQSVTGAIHELGHGLYEQNIDSKYSNTPLHRGVSLGVHESQSRLLENMIGRSDEFWIYSLKLLKKYFPKAAEVEYKDIANYLNNVKPSFIRIEADEVTYNLHIILRFEVEQQMLKSDFNLKNLPGLWDSKMVELLGIKPKDLSEGCLQDVHWSLGLIGYFPTYTLGNLLSAQLWQKFTNENKEYSNQIATGDFSKYYNWFKKNIWTHGSMYKPLSLIKSISGSSYKTTDFLKYLQNKYII